MATLVEESGPLPVARVLFLLKQVCHSLAEAHARGLVHRDIKPANIFVCRMGLDHDVVKVLDFGLVHEVRRDRDEDLTKSLASLGGVVGTPAFMAPESLAGDKAVDHRADLYALGCVAFFLLTGQHVFHGRTPLQALMDHVTHAAATAVDAYRQSDPGLGRRPGAGVPGQGSRRSPAERDRDRAAHRDARGQRAVDTGAGAGLVAHPPARPGRPQCGTAALTCIDLSRRAALSCCRRAAALALPKTATAGDQSVSASTANAVARSDMNIRRHGSPFSPPCSRSKFSECARHGAEPSLPPSSGC